MREGLFVGGVRLIPKQFKRGIWRLLYPGAFDWSRDRKGGDIHGGSSGMGIRKGRKRIGKREKEEVKRAGGGGESEKKSK